MTRPVELRRVESAPGDQLVSHFFRGRLSEADNLPSWLPGLEPATTAGLDDELYSTLMGPFSADIVDYLTLARETGGPIADLGCGRGRLTVPLANQGFEVDAFDKDVEALQSLRSWIDRGPQSRASRTRILEADLGTLDFDRSYGMAFLAGGSLAALSTDARRHLLARLATNTLHAGLIAFDYTVHDPASLVHEPERVWAFRVPRFDDSQELVIAHQTFDLATGTESLTYYIERFANESVVRRTVTAQNKLVIDPEELHRDLARAGLRILEERTHPIDDHCTAVLTVCQPSRG